MPRVLLSLVILGLLVYALTDCVVTPDRRVGGLPKALWLLIIVLIPVVGPAAWLLTSRTATAGGSGRGGSSRRPGPVAPDDDPDFLWKLDQDRRRDSHDGSHDANGDTSS